MTERSALVIDDEPDIIEYHTSLLTDNGWSVRSANNGDDGLALAREETPDVILLDVMMPERGGLSTLIALRKEPSVKDVPVVLVTGIKDQLTADFGAFLDRFKHYNPNGYVEKPFDPDKLLKLLDEVTSK